MKRLYLQFYLTIVATLVLVVVTAGALWRFASEAAPVNQAFHIAGDLVAVALPPAEAPHEAQQQALGRIAERLRADLGLFDPAGGRIAAVGRPVPPPDPARESGGWLYGLSGQAWSVRLPDGRWLVARIPGHRGHPGIALMGFLGGIALAVGIGAYPVVRGLTRRLERLQAGVESLGAGDLAARVKVEGRDEVARLAESFNRAAARIEDVVGAHKMLLANASHELRTPLARIRLGVELLKDRADQKQKNELETDIAELDQLIDEILVASRLDVLAKLEVEEDIDLLALAAEEGARYEQCTVSGKPVLVRGDPRLLRRMVRNLLENARRHGRAPITVTVRGDAEAVLSVCDQGPGIAEADRERIFSPFNRAAVGSVTGGTGLGLALVRQIARCHGGDALYGPRDGLASCFTVKIPLARRS